MFEMMGAMFICVGKNTNLLTPQSHRFLSQFCQESRRLNSQQCYPFDMTYLWDIQRYLFYYPCQSQPVMK